MILKPFITVRQSPICPNLQEQATNLTGGTITIPIREIRTKTENYGSQRRIYTCMQNGRPKQSTVTLDADGGTLFGANYFSVNYGEPYSISVTVSKTGYTFEGWYDENNKRYMTASGQGVDVLG